MHYYAHPAYCPDCRTRRQPQAERCQRCGLVLVGEPTDQLYAVLAEADDRLERLRETSRSFEASSAEPPTEPPTEPPAEPTQAPARSRRVTAGSVLLVLGALLLVVAATVFVAVAWGSLSLAARTVLLLGVTGVVAAVALVCLRRTLRASAEALWAVTSAMLLVDLAAAYTADLAGLGDLDGRGVLSLAAAVLAFPSAAAALLARSHWTDGSGRRYLATAELAVVAGSAAAVGALAWDWAYDLVWLPIAALGLLTGWAAAARLAGLRVASVGVGSLTAVSYLVAVLAAVGQLDDEPSLREVAGGSGAPALVLLAVSVAIVAAPRAPPPVPALAAFVAAGLAVALLVYPAAEAGEVPLTWVVALASVTLASLGALPGGGWLHGVRAAAVLGAVWLLALAAEPASTAVDTVVRAALPVWYSGADARLRMAADEPGWFGLLAMGGLAAVVALSGWWSIGSHRVRSRAELRGVLHAVAGLALAGGALVMAASYPILVAVLTTAAVLAAGAAVGGQVLALSPTTYAAVLAPAVAVVSTGVVASLGSAGLSAVALAAASAALLAAALLAPDTLGTVPLSAVGFVLADLAVLAAVHALGATGNVAPVVVVTAGTVVATSLARWVGAGAGFGAELAAALGLVVATALAASVGPGTLAVTLTVLGGVAVVVGLLRGDRQPVRWLGVALLQAAWTVRLLDTDVDVVEVYTLPAGVALTAVGVWTLLYDRRAGTARTVLPGLALAVLPSLPQALLEPTSARAWLVGAAGVGLVGAAVRLRWSAPLLVGGLAVVVVALAHLASAAEAVPRWVALAVVGTGLLAVGITWESRVRQARALASYVADLR